MGGADRGQAGGWGLAPAGPPPSSNTPQTGPSGAPPGAVRRGVEVMLRAVAPYAAERAAASATAAAAARDDDDQGAPSTAPAGGDGNANQGTTSTALAPTAQPRASAP